MEDAPVAVATGATSSERHEPSVTDWHPAASRRPVADVNFHGCSTFRKWSRWNRSYFCLDALPGCHGGFVAAGHLCRKEILVCPSGGTGAVLSHCACTPFGSLRAEGERARTEPVQMSYSQVLQEIEALLESGDERVVALCEYEVSDLLTDPLR